MENEDFTKKITHEILEVLESNKLKGYVIEENDYEKLKLKCEVILGNKPKNKLNEKVNFNEFSIYQIKDGIIDLPRYKSSIILGMTIFWILLISIYIASGLGYFIPDNFSLIILLSIPAIFGIVYNPYVGGSIGFLSSLPFIALLYEFIDGAIVLIMIFTLIGILPKILILVISPPIFNKLPKLKDWLNKYDWIVSFSIGVFINLFSGFIFAYLQLNLHALK